MLEVARQHLHADESGRAGDQHRLAGHTPHLTTVAPHVKPAPNAPRRTLSPGRSCPWRSEYSSASGSVAADVLPYSPMQAAPGWGATPSRSPTAARIRPFAWW